MQPLLQRQPSQHDLLNSLGVPHTLAPSDVHVLLVDDERLSRMVVGNVLRRCNYRGARPTPSCSHPVQNCRLFAVIGWP